MTHSEALPQRRKPPHTIPPWVQQGARHFITINCKARGVNSLCGDDVATGLLSSARKYEEIGHWYLWLMVIMPDHVHIIATFDLERGPCTIIKGWKGFQKRKLHIEWQSDFFEHRIRTDDEFVEKMHYVRMNPVRKGLTTSPDAWPYVLVRTDLTAERGALHGRAKPPAEPSEHAARQGRLALPKRSESEHD